MKAWAIPAHMEAPMRVTLVPGVVAGLLAGVLFATMLTIMSQPLRGDGFGTLMGQLTGAVGSKHLLVGWALVLAVSAVLGGLFGVLAGARGLDAGTVTSLGLFYGLALWVMVGLVVVPRLLGLPAAAALRARELWPWLPAILIGCMLFVGVLSAVFVWLSALLRRDVPVAKAAPLRRAA
jgi:hypothetical protein